MTPRSKPTHSLLTEVMIPRSKYTGRIIMEELVHAEMRLDGAYQVPPGGTYRTTCRPNDHLRLSEILVYDFTLAELYVDHSFVSTALRADDRDRGDLTAHLYRLRPSAVVVPTASEVELHLKNTTNRSLPAREAHFEESQKP